MILLGQLRIALVRGPSMVPTLRDGDRVLVLMGTPRRPVVGRVVLVELPDRPWSVKRVIRIESDGSVWLEGDNEFGSTDSRQLGAIPAGAVRGTVVLRLWPKPAFLR